MEKILDAVIIEDEYDSLELLRRLISGNPKARVTGWTSDPSMAISLILDKNPDIVFLDIRMPGKNGFEVLDELHYCRSAVPHIVFTTAYDEYAIKAFEYAAFDYLLKPIAPMRLNETLIRCLENRVSGQVQPTSRLLESYQKLLFRNLSGVVIIDPDEVVFITADGNYSVFHFGDGRSETVTSLLHKVEEQLPIEKFFRISRSGIINTKYLKKINTRQMNCLLIKDGNEFRIEISREKSRELIEKMRLP